MFKVIIDKKKCNGCGNCVVACPHNASISPESGHGFGVSDSDCRVVNASAEFLGRCSGCGICIEVCPVDAIKLIRKNETLA